MRVPDKCFFQKHVVHTIFDILFCKSITRDSNCFGAVVIATVVVMV